MTSRNSLSKTHTALGAFDGHMTDVQHAVHAARRTRSRERISPGRDADKPGAGGLGSESPT